MPLTIQARLLVLSRILCGLSLVVLVTRIILFRTMSFWAQLPYDPAHPTPVDYGVRTFHVTPFVGFCANYGYLFFLFFLAAFVFMAIVDAKSRAPRPGGPANLS